MLAVLLTISALFVQGVPLAPNQGGSVTGVIRTAAGAPAVGVRVMALARPENLKDLATASSFAGLGETDATGRYRLENVPPGRYYIIAGRVDLPTFFPGTVQAAEGSLVSVERGVTGSSIDFVLNNASAGRVAGTGNNLPVASIQVSVEGGKVPIFADGKFPVIRFTRDGVAPIEIPLTAPNVTLPYADYRPSVENLPNGYRAQPIPRQMVAFGVLPVRATIIYTQPPVSTGVRLSGRIVGDFNRSLYISGKAGAIYADGTFEFVGVPPGQHTIVTLDNPGSLRPLGVAIVVSDRDLENISLDEVSVAPADAKRPPANTPAGSRAPGSRIPLSAIRGRVTDADTRAPFNAGKAYLNGDYAAGFSLDNDGRFEIPKLLPGTYNLEVFVYGVGSVKRAVVIDGEDIALDLSLGP